MSQTQWFNWQVVTKLDPDRNNPIELLELVCSSGTDAIIIGGTQGITSSKVESLLKSVKNLVGNRIPIVIEVSHPQAVVPGGDQYFIPVVLNSSEQEWIVGAHQKMFLKIGSLAESICLDKLLVPEGYIILNSDCAAARKSKARTNINIAEILSFVRVAKYLLKLPLIYMEYSGSLGQTLTLAEVKKILGKTRLFYGGGIETVEHAKAFAEYADTLVVGNIIYKNPEILNDLVQAVKACQEKRLLT